MPEQTTPQQPHVHGEGGRWRLRTAAEIHVGNVILCDPDAIEAVSAGDLEAIDWRGAAGDAAQVREVERRYGDTRVWIDGYPGHGYQELLRWELG